MTNKTHPKTVKPKEEKILEAEGDEDSQIIILNKKIVDLELVVGEQNDRLLRSLAEMENIRKRAVEDLEKANKYAVSKFASELVMVVENFYLAVDNMPKEEIESSDKLKNFATGVVMTQKELAKVLEQNGIKRINPIGEEFNHNYHEAIAHTQGEGESGTIKKVIQAGYTIGDRLIKPALVEVCK